MSNGKGSTRRPKAVSDAELAARWEMAFNVREHIDEAYRNRPADQAHMTLGEWLRMDA